MSEKVFSELSESNISSIVGKQSTRFTKLKPVKDVYSQHKIFSAQIEKLTEEQVCKYSQLENLCKVDIRTIDYLTALDQCSWNLADSMVKLRNQYPELDDRLTGIAKESASNLGNMELTYEIVKFMTESPQIQDEVDVENIVVLIADALLTKAKKLFESGVHPIRVAEDFELASRVAVERLEQLVSMFQFDANNIEPMVQTCMATLSTKLDGHSIAEIAVKAVLAVADIVIREENLNLIEVEGKLGGKWKDSELVNGIIVDKKISHPEMTKEIQDAKIAFLSFPFTVDADSDEKFENVLFQKQKYLDDFVQQCMDVGANFVFCKFGFNDEVSHFLMHQNLPTVQLVAENELKRIATATGGIIVPTFQELTSEKLGKAGVLRVKSFGTGEGMLFIEKCANSRVVTVLVCEGNQPILDLRKVLICEAMKVTKGLIRDCSFVYAGGSVELVCSTAVKAAANRFNPFKRSGITAFGDALLSVSKAVARKSGLKPIETISEAKFQDINNVAIDGFDAPNIFESLIEKQGDIMLAMQVVKKILRIDDFISPNLDLRDDLVC